MNTRKFLCLFVMALAVFALSGCGGGHDGELITPLVPNTQSEDVTPTPTTSEDVTPTPTTSPDVPTPPASQDITPTPTPSTESNDTASGIEDSTLDVTDTATASKVLYSLTGTDDGTEVADLLSSSVGAERSIVDVSTEDLAAIPENETPAMALPIITVNNPAVYVWGQDLSSLNEGDYIYLHMFPEATTAAASFSASASDESEICAFLDDSGSKITRVPASKKVNVAAYMTPEYTYAPVITTSKSASDEPAQSEDVTPVVPTPTPSDDFTPVVPTPTPSDDVTPVVPESGDTTPDVPSGPASGDTPPDMPTSGDVPSGPASGDTPPDIPSGEDSGDNAPSDSGDSGDSSTPTESETVTGGTYTSSTAFENALLINGATSTYTNITVTKTGDASGQSENYDWYGTNAAILAQGGADVTISGANTSITTNAVGGNAVFAYGGNSSMNTNNSGDGTKITISDATITTSKNNSGGIMVTGGGIIEASNLTITTSSGSSAAIRSDRGGGTITVTGGTYTTSGTGSPAIYSTAAITGNDVTLESKTAQVVVIEGGNSVTLVDSKLTANHNQLNGQDTTYQAIMIYQSQSGDASSGSSFFKMTGGSLTNAHGDIFHVTNTTTTITLSESIAITNNDSTGYFLRASTDSWGGSDNGGKVTLNADGQTIDGNMLVDSVSTLAFNMTNSSIFNGAINTTGTAGNVSVVMDSTSVWNLTGDSYLTSEPEGGTINRGSYNIYVNGVLFSD